MTTILLTIAIIIQAVCVPPVCMPELQQDKTYMPFVASATHSIGEPPTIPTEVGE